MDITKPGTFILDYITCLGSPINSESWMSGSYYSCIGIQFILTQISIWLKFDLQVKEIVGNRDGSITIRMVGCKNVQHCKSICIYSHNIWLIHALVRDTGSWLDLFNNVFSPTWCRWYYGLFCGGSPFIYWSFCPKCFLQVNILLLCLLYIWISFVFFPFPWSTSKRCINLQAFLYLQL